MVYRIGLLAQRETIYEWNHSLQSDISPLSQNKKRLGQVYGSPAVLEWKVAAGWTPFITASEERVTLVAPAYPVSERNYAQGSSASLAIWRCSDWGNVRVTGRRRWARGHRRLTSWGAILCNRPPSVLLLLGNAAAGGGRTSQGRWVAQTKQPLSACFLLAQSELLWPHRAVWGSHCCRARGVGYSLFVCVYVCVCPWSVKSHNAWFNSQ